MQANLFTMGFSLLMQHLRGESSNPAQIPTAHSSCTRAVHAYRECCLQQLGIQSYRPEEVIGGTLLSLMESWGDYRALATWRPFKCVPGDHA